MTGAKEGIRLGGSGSHTVNGVTIPRGKSKLCLHISLSHMCFSECVHLFIYSVGEGIVVNVNDNTIINNFIPESRFVGVTIGSSSRNIIKGNTIVKARTGISFSIISFGSRGTPDDNQILGNTILSSRDNGISLLSKRNFIQGNTIDRSGSIGIFVDDLRDNNVRAALGSEDTVIKGNSITNSKVGIQILRPGTRFSGVIEGLNTAVVIENTFAGNVFDDITNRNIDETGLVEAGNIFGGLNPPPEECGVCPPPNPNEPFKVELDTDCRGVIGCQGGRQTNSFPCPPGTLATRQTSLNEIGFPNFDQDGNLLCQSESEVTCECEPL